MREAEHALGVTQTWRLWISLMAPDRPVTSGDLRDPSRASASDGHLDELAFAGSLPACALAGRAGSEERRTHGPEDRESGYDQKAARVTLGQSRKVRCTSPSRAMGRCGRNGGQDGQAKRSAELTTGVEQA
jgi:hypothetical protein